MMMRALAVVAMIATALAVSARAEPPECGVNATTLLCPGCLCCSHWGFCGTGPAYCGDGCQSQCNGCDDADDSVASIVTPSLFEKLLPHRNDYNCPASGFFTYDAFIAGAATVAGFGTTGDVDTRKREVAAWLAQESHDTTGGWEDAPDGPYAWGFCYKPAQIVNTDMNATNTDMNATAFFEMAIGKWMEARTYLTRPSCHDVVTGEWTPSADDLAAGRMPGFGVITNIIDGDECGHGTTDDRSENRIEFYKRFCDILGVSYGDNLDCYNQKPFGSTTTSTGSDHAEA